MEIDVVEASPAEVAADVLAFAVPEPIELQSAGQELDRLVDGGIKHLIEDGELKGERGRVTLLHTRKTLKAHRLAAAGVGGDGDADSLRTAAAETARRVSEVGGKTVAWILGDSAATAARSFSKIASSHSTMRSSAPRTFSSYSLSAGVMKRSPPAMVCLRM